MGRSRLGRSKEYIVDTLSQARYGMSFDMLYNTLDSNVFLTPQHLRRVLNILISSDFVRCEMRNSCKECAANYTSYHLTDKGRLFVHHIKHIPTFEETWGYNKNEEAKPK